MTSEAGRPGEAERRAARRDAILAVAQEGFLADGYAATSMSSIAAALGGSKATLYAYFSSKEELFAAIMEGYGDTLRKRFESLGEHEGSLSDRLAHYGDAYLGTLFSSGFIDLSRVVISEAGRLPEIGAIFERATVQSGRWVVDTLAAEMRAGRLRTDDPELVARHFLALCSAHIYTQVLWGLASPPNEDGRAALAAEAVRVLLAAWHPET